MSRIPIDIDPPHPEVPPAPHPLPHPEEVPGRIPEEIPVQPEHPVPTA